MFDSNWMAFTNVRPSGLDVIPRCWPAHIWLDPMTGQALPTSTVAMRREAGKHLDRCRAADALDFPALDCEFVRGRVTDLGAKQSQLGWRLDIYYPTTVRGEAPCATSTLHDRIGPRLRQCVSRPTGPSSTGQKTTGSNTLVEAGAFVPASALPVSRSRRPTRARTLGYCTSTSQSRLVAQSVMQVLVSPAYATHCQDLIAFAVWPSPPPGCTRYAVLVQVQDRPLSVPDARWSR